MTPKDAVFNALAIFRSPKFLFGLVFIVSACQHGPLQTKKEIVATKGPPRVLVMPSEVTLYELTAGGLKEPQAAWTQRGKENVDRALESVLTENKSKFVVYKTPDPDDAGAERQRQVIALQDVIAQTILLANYSGRHLGLKSELDYSVGTSAQSLNSKNRADYALFVTMTDSFSSAGRRAVMALGALVGISVRGANQAGLASLVDLKTGEVIWFNVFAKGFGDLREPSGAISAVRTLLAEFPLWTQQQDDS
ncbi:MAG TPA: hypothetical protein DCE33_12160 [Rhodospirillaceae bacterium]|nr:hypothetical protein [Rhodospirillaceae bacterium]